MIDVCAGFNGRDIDLTLVVKRRDADLRISPRVAALADMDRR
jgi:hypothetical protein